MSDRAGAAQQAAGRAAREGREVAERVQDSKPYRALVTLGLICFGLVHLLVAALALQVAFGVGGETTDQQGALAAVAAQPFGVLALVVAAVGLFALVVWQLFEAAVGHRWFDGGKRVRKRLSSAFRAVVYGSLGVAAIRYATGGGSQGGSGTEEQASSSLLTLPFGQVLLVVVGLAVIGLGGYQAYKGIRGKYEDDLSGSLHGARRVVAVLGHVAKGVAYVIVGGLFVAAAASDDAEAAGGLDAALQLLVRQPFGQILLAAMAFGLACYGVYCFLWSRRARHS